MSDDAETCPNFKIIKTETLSQNIDQIAIEK